MVLMTSATGSGTSLNLVAGPSPSRDTVFLGGSGESTKGGTVSV